MSTVDPGSELIPPPMCLTCRHTAPPTCHECGGRNGSIVDGLAACLRCASRYAQEQAIDPEAPTDVIIAPSELLATYESGAIAERVAAGLTEYASGLLAATELTDPEAVEQILGIDDGLGPGELPQYRTPPDVVAELVPRMASYRELWSEALTWLRLLDGLDQNAARDAALDALRLITDRYRERAGS